MSHPTHSPEALTPAQARLLQVLAQMLHDGQKPTVRELASRCGYANHQAVQRLLKLLIEKGYLAKEVDGTQGYRLRQHDMPTERGIPLIGSVAAGQPLLALEHIEQWLALPPELFTQKPDFLLWVRGDSMINAGIHDGDWVAIVKTAIATPGDIIVARLDDEVTLKQLGGSSTQPKLLAHNPAYAPIELTGRDWAVEGRYVGLVRREVDVAAISNTS